MSKVDSPGAIAARPMSAWRAELALDVLKFALTGAVAFVASAWYTGAQLEGGRNVALVPVQAEVLRFCEVDIQAVRTRKIELEKKLATQFVNAVRTSAVSSPSSSSSEPAKVTPPPLNIDPNAAIAGSIDPLLIESLSAQVPEASRMIRERLFYESLIGSAGGKDKVTLPSKSLAEFQVKLHDEGIARCGSDTETTINFEVAILVDTPRAYLIKSACVASIGNAKVPVRLGAVLPDAKGGSIPGQTLPEVFPISETTRAMATYSKDEAARAIDQELTSAIKLIQDGREYNVALSCEQVDRSGSGQIGDGELYVFTANKLQGTAGFWRHLFGA